MTGKAQFIIGDSIQVLSAWTGDSIQTTIFDPPYNVGFDYGPGGHQDKLPDQEYQELIFELAHASFNVSKDSASFFMVHYPEATARLLPVLERAGWTFHQWISWVYPTNTGHSKSKFTTAHRTILWMRKAPKFKDVKFYNKATVQPYKNPNDKRIKARIANGELGSAHYDWWELNLCKNVSKDYSGYFNQLPQLLLERLILATSDPDDIILDPCGGSGSTAKVAKNLNRHGVAIDKSPHAFPGREPTWSLESLKLQTAEAVDSFPAPPGAQCDHQPCGNEAVLEETFKYQTPDGPIMAGRYHCLEHSLGAEEE